MMIDLSNYKNYLSDKAHEVLKLAIEESHKRQHYYLGVEHVFLALTHIEDDFSNEVMVRLGINPKKMLEIILHEMDSSKQFMGEGMKVLTPTKTVLKFAWENAQSSGRKLIDPIDQAERFKQQAEARAAGDMEAMEVDNDFLLCMEYGMPPISGWGMGIDRMVALLTNTKTLRDVILFPLLKPLSDEI